MWRGNDSIEQANWKEIWGLVAWDEALGFLSRGFWGKDALDVVADPYAPERPVLRVRYDKDGVTTESGISMLFQPTIELKDKKQACLFYDILFDYDIDFGVIGGKLTGLFGFTPDATTTLDAISCAGPCLYDSAVCFSARFSYRNLHSLGYPETDIFIELIPWMDESECRDSWLCDLPYGEGMAMKNAHPESFAAIKGEWRNIRQEIRLNDEGLANGYMRVWYQNTQVYDELNLTITRSDKVPVSGILMHGLFGQEIANGVIFYIEIPDLFWGIRLLLISLLLISNISLREFPQFYNYILHCLYRR